MQLKIPSQCDMICRYDKPQCQKLIPMLIKNIYCLSVPQPTHWPLYYINPTQHYCEYYKTHQTSQGLPHLTQNPKDAFSVVDVARFILEKLLIQEHKCACRGDDDLYTAPEHNYHYYLKKNDRIKCRCFESSQTSIIKQNCDTLL